jgi:uncharacterized protein YjbJ (UPF0337 family)
MAHGRDVSAIAHGSIPASNEQGSNRMNRDRLVGVGKIVVGSVKQAVGKLVGDAKWQIDGKAEQIEGKLRNTVGSAKATLKR